MTTRRRACAAGLLWPLAGAGVAQDAARLLGRSMPYDAFDQLPATVLELAGARLRLAHGGATPPQGNGALVDWVTAAARAIEAYYGRFPVAALAILVVTVPGREIHGTTWGYRGAATRIVLGAELPAAALRDDWVLVHEMVHVATPRLDRTHDWLTEGLATYVEPLARVLAGQLAAPRIWSDMLRGMPNGMPQAGDQGLDQTHTWGRTYWGGALFCLQADLEIRRRTGNRRGLRDALRAIVAAGGSNESEWPIAKLLAVGDQATGVAVLDEFYRRDRATPTVPDLDALWRRLGVAARDGTIVFDDAAPDAALRRALTAAAP